MASLGEWAGDHLLAVLFLFALCVGGLAITGLGVLGVFLLALLGVGGPLAATLSGLTVPFLVGVLLFTPLSVVTLVGLLYGLGKRAPKPSVPRPRLDNLRQWAAYGEREYPWLRYLGLAEALDRRSPEQRAHDRLDALKRGYVEGKLGAEEFEARTAEVVADSPLDRDQLLDDADSFDRHVEQELADADVGPRAEDIVTEAEPERDGADDRGPADGRKPADGRGPARDGADLARGDAATETEADGGERARDVEYE